MEKEKKPKEKVKVTFQSSPLVLKLVLTFLIVFSIGALAALRWVHLGLRERIDDMREEAAAVERANEQLEEKKEALGSVQSIEDIAKEELGLVDPNTVVITPSAPATPATGPAN